MKAFGAVQVERYGALLLLVVSVAATYWLSRQAAAVANSANVREEQIERLATLVDRRGAGLAAEATSLVGFEGLFAGHQVVWQAGPHGQVLSLQVDPPEDSR